MTNLLVLRSSATGAQSVSNGLIDELLSQWRAREPGVRVVNRDLDREPLPYVTQANLAGIGRVAPETPATAETRALSDLLIGEAEAADVLVIGAPMYNFGLPSTLKSWFDYALRAGRTFNYTAAGPEGLLRNKRAIVVSVRAGLYSEGAGVANDHQEPHLRTLLSFVGIDDVEFVRVEKLAYGDEARAEALAAARAQLPEVIRPSFAAAA